MLSTITTVVLYLFSNFKSTLIYAAVALAITVGTGLYVKGRADASHAIEIAQLKADNERLQNYLKVAADVKIADDIQSAKDTAELADFQGQANELLTKLEDASRNCLSVSDTKRLRDIWDK